MRRRNPTDGAPQRIDFAPDQGSTTLDFPHPEISDMIRRKESKIPFKTAPIQVDTNEELAKAYDDGWKAGRKLQPNGNPYRKDSGH